MRLNNSPKETFGLEKEVPKWESLCNNWAIEVC
jgi:hypothetical protein